MMAEARQRNGTKHSKDKPFWGCTLSDNATLQLAPSFFMVVSLLPTYQEFNIRWQQPSPARHFRRAFSAKGNYRCTSPADSHPPQNLQRINPDIPGMLGSIPAQTVTSWDAISQTAE
ncbi:hypothetical protein MKZ38_000984 [Zalerion maritima]|uniref:Uncharacterized protein n=1 Tax=Zalerion maritima TaxID=339359 RepID=A0AAD5WS86_9PEZI|nr:hypothetical protein MKZ38_000984 [Zalerion maritima]